MKNWVAEGIASDVNDVKMFDAFAIVVGLREHMGTVGICPCLGTFSNTLQG